MADNETGEQAAVETPVVDAADVEPQKTEEKPARPLAEIAREMYGSKFVGEVNADQEGEPKAQPAEDAAETDEDAAETETEAAQESEQVEESEIGSIEDLARQFDLSPEDVRKLRVKIKVDGAESETALDDVIASYQMREAAEKRLSEAKQRAEQDRQQSAQQLEQVNAQFAIAAQLIQQVESQIEADSTKIDWDKLRVEDPAEYSAKKADFIDRRERLAAMKADAGEKFQGAIKLNQQQALNRQAEMIVAEQAKLLQKLPQWQDPKTANEEKTAIAKYLTAQGFAANEIAHASDHRLIVMARKAMLYDSNGQKSEVAKKKLAVVPKTLKPGTPKAQDQVKSEQMRQVEDRLKKTGSVQDAAALLRLRRGA